MKTDKEILVAARYRVAKNLDGHICHAIQHARLGTKKQKHDLRAWVMSTLDGPGTYESWVKINHPLLWIDTHWPERVMRLKAGRLAWLDWMIEEVSK